MVEVAVAAVLPFDTLRYARRMKSFGFTDRQAEGMADAQAELIGGELATKHDIEELRAATERNIAESRTATQRDIAELRAETKRDIADVRREIAELRASTEQNIEKLRVELKHDIEKLRVELKRDIADVQKSVSTMGLRLAVVMGVIMMGGIGVIATIVKL